MMNVLAISASASSNSSNFQLLQAIQQLLSETHHLALYDTLNQFELFTPEKLKEGIPQNIQDFKDQIINNDAVIISTPEYTHNIPAVLKNMIEWCTHSGEFSAKKVLPITFTPYEPRGEYAMRSLLQSLEALDAKVVGQLPLYKTDVEVLENKIVFSKEMEEIVLAAVEML